MTMIKKTDSVTEADAAYRDSNIQISGVNARVQLVDTISMIGTSMTYGTPTRTVTTDDAAQITNPLTSTGANGLQDTALDLTSDDKNILTVAVDFQSTAADGYVIIMPLLLDGSDNAFSALWPKIFQGYYDGGLSTPVNIGGTYILTPMQSWIIRNAAKVALFAMLRSATEARIYAELTTGPVDDFVSLKAESAYGQWSAIAGGGE